MKKRLFTLLALGMLVGGISSTLNAQVTLAGVAISNGTVNGEKGVYEKKVVKDSPLSVTTMDITLGGLNAPTTEKKITVYFDYNATAEYLGLPASYTFDKLDTIKSSTFKTVKVTVKSNWDMPNSVNGTKGIIRATLDKSFLTGIISDTAAYYNYPTFKVEYRPTTAQYTGELMVSSITGGNPKYNDYMTRYLKKDSVYSYFTYDKVFVEFSEIEVANLTYGDKIIVHTTWEDYILNIPRVEDNVPPGIILRPVTVPVVSDAILNVEAGIQQVPSTYDFSFTIKPTGSNTGKKPVVTTGRTSIPDSEGVTYKQLSDGSWVVTVANIQSPINLTIDFTVSNASIENNSVWANGGQLYINAATSSKVSIYSITGALVKTVATAAGETASISIPTGFYVVTVNGKAYKVTVK